jgi:hypothetical protein
MRIEGGDWFWFSVNFGDGVSKAWEWGPERRGGSE